MAQQTADDARTVDMKQEMARHFAEFEADYRDADWCSIVYEDDHCVVIADHKGYEFDEWADDLSLTYDAFSETMHALARSVCDRSWPADYPVVFDKLENDE